MKIYLFSLIVILQTNISSSLPSPLLTLYATWICWTYYVPHVAESYRNSCLCLCEYKKLRVSKIYYDALRIISYFFFLGRMDCHYRVITIRVQIEPEVHQLMFSFCSGCFNQDIVDDSVSLKCLATTHFFFIISIWI